MSQRETPKRIDMIAADWVARVDLAPLSVEDKALLDEWLQASSLHRGAFGRAEAVLAIASEAARSGEITHPQVDVPPRDISRVSRRQILWTGGSAAAAAVAAAAIFTPYLNVDPRFENYQTKRGEVRILPLEDGSVVTLNTDSQIGVRFQKAKREILLIKGEALFDVEKDPSRPFTVTTGDTVVRAVGTSFVVRDLKDQRIEVLVREGAVDMFRQQIKDQPLRVLANSKAVALEVPVPSVKLVAIAMDPAEVARRLAWRQGMISFEDAPLKEAAAEFNRYSDVQIIIDDPRIENRAVTGLFSAHNPVGFARSIALGFNLKIVVTPTRVMLWQ